MAMSRGSQGTSESQPARAVPTTGMPGPGGRHRGGRIERARDVRGTLVLMLDRLRAYRWFFVGVSALVAVGAVAELLTPMLMGRTIDVLTSESGRMYAVQLIVLMAVAYAISWASGIAQGMVMATVSQRIMRDLRKDLFGHLQTFSLSFFDRHPHGELMSRLTNDLDFISRVLSQNITQLFSGIVSLVGVLIMMFVINWRLALGSLFIFPIMMWLVGFVGKRTRGGFRDYQRAIGQLNGQLEEMFGGQRVIVAYGRQSTMLEEFDTANGTVMQIGIRAQAYAMLVPPLMGILSNANIAIVAGLGGWMALRGLATIGTIAAFYLYSRRFAAPLRQLANLYNQVQTALAGAERVLEILAQQPEISDVPGATVLEHVRGDVEFDDADFGYVPGIPVLQRVDLNARAGQTVAFVGPTGAGKTTIINLLTRFYDLDSRNHSSRWF